METKKATEKSIKYELSANKIDMNQLEAMLYTNHIQLADYEIKKQANTNYELNYKIEENLYTYMSNKIGALTMKDMIHSLLITLANSDSSLLYKENYVLHPLYIGVDVIRNTFTFIYLPFKAEFIEKKQHELNSSLFLIVDLINETFLKNKYPDIKSNIEDLFCLYVLKQLDLYSVLEKILQELNKTDEILYAYKRRTNNILDDLDRGLAFFEKDGRMWIKKSSMYQSIDNEIIGHKEITDKIQQYLLESEGVE